VHRLSLANARWGGFLAYDTFHSGWVPFHKINKALFSTLACTATMNPDHNCDASTNGSGNEERDKAGKGKETSMMQVFKI
jgi:hypothetical protein